MRKNLDTEAGPRYAGTKSSRKELYGEPFGQVEDDETEEEAASSGDEEEDEAAESVDEEDDDEQSQEDEDNDDASSAEMNSEASGRRYTKEARVDGPSGSNTNGINSHLDKDSRAMMQELKKASSADIEKGRDVRKQLVRRKPRFAGKFCRMTDVLFSLFGTRCSKHAFACRNV